tara:strand:- start:22 stop:219 length:198 start_codon:yes stop_codon:yes gene_type:complete
MSKDKCSTAADNMDILKELDDIRQEESDNADIILNESGVAIEKLKEIYANGDKVDESVRIYYFLI